MSQKKNKIIVLFFLILIILVAGYLIFSRYQYKQLTSTIYVHVFGQSWDSKINGNIQIPDIKVKLLSNNLSTVIAEKMTDKNGNCIFNNIPVNNSYWITISNNEVLTRYYIPYQYKIFIPYSLQKINHSIELILSDISQRDVKRQNILSLYQNLLEVYKKDHGYYPLSKNFREKIININDHLITLLTPYLIKNKLTADKLLDPLLERPIVYWSDGNNYKIWIFPEIILDISVFNKKENAYFIEK